MYIHTYVDHIQDVYNKVGFLLAMYYPEKLPCQKEPLRLLQVDLLFQVSE